MLIRKQISERAVNINEIHNNNNVYYLLHNNSARWLEKITRLNNNSISENKLEQFSIFDRSPY